MGKYEQARRNMVQCQLSTNGIVDEKLSNIYGFVPRERFLPPEKHCAAYSDEDIILGKSGYMMEPLVHARMVQALDPHPDANVLVVGDVTGYSCAVLSNIVSTVVSLEPKKGCLDHAKTVWEELSFCNIPVLKGDVRKGCPEHAPYDLIFVNGAVAEVPEALLEQLSPGGRLVTVMKPDPLGTGTVLLVQRLPQGGFSHVTYQDASPPYVEGLEPQPAFAF